MASNIHKYSLFIFILFDFSHQIGFFRDLHVNVADNQQANAANPPNQPNAGNQPNQPNAGNQPNQPNAANQPNQPNQANQPADQPPQAPQPATNNTQQSLLAVTWMIFTSFFASLIPDTN